MSSAPIFSDYAAHLLGWSMPCLVLQWVVGARTLVRDGRAVVVGALVPTVWLSTADALAIRQGIWTFDMTHLWGWCIGGVPVEEVLFFAITSLLVSQSVVLLLHLRPRSRGSRPVPPPAA